MLFFVKTTKIFQVGKMMKALNELLWSRMWSAKAFQMQKKKNLASLSKPNLDTYKCTNNEIPSTV